MTKRVHAAHSMIISLKQEAVVVGEWVEDVLLAWVVQYRAVVGLLVHQLEVAEFRVEDVLVHQVVVGCQEVVVDWLEEEEDWTEVAVASVLATMMVHSGVAAAATVAASELKQRVSAPESARWPSPLCPS